MFKNFEPLNSTLETQNNESYTIVLNSNLASGTVNQAIFNFDWSILPNRSYTVHHSFNTSNMSITTGKVCTISSNLFSGSNTFIASSQDTRTSANSSNFIGVAYPYIYGAVSALHAEDSTSPPIYISTRPSANQFTISIETADAVPVDYPSLGAWVLVLQFRPDDKPNRSLI
jgi:hypothetical protein